MEWKNKRALNFWNITRITYKRKNWNYLSKSLSWPFKRSITCSWSEGKKVDTDSNYEGFYVNQHLGWAHWLWLKGQRCACYLLHAGSLTMKKEVAPSSELTAQCYIKEDNQNCENHKFYVITTYISLVMVWAMSAYTLYLRNKKRGKTFGDDTYIIFMCKLKFDK
jgi:hypothetical protein